MIIFCVQVSMVCNLSFDTTKLVVVVDGQVGVIGVDFSGIKCYVCESINCSHVSYIKSFELNDAATPVCVAEFTETKTNQPRKQRKTTSVSQNKIYFEPSGSYKNTLGSPPFDSIPQGYIDGKARLILVGSTFVGACQDQDHIPIDVDVDNQAYKPMLLVTKDNVYDCACMYYYYYFYFIEATYFI